MELKKAEEQNQREQEAQTYRARRIDELPGLISAAQRSVEQAAYVWILSGLVYLTLWALSLLVVPWAALVTREQKETGQSLAGLIADRRLIAKFMKSITHLSFWTGNVRLVLLLLPQFVLGVVILWAKATSHSNDFLSVIALVGGIWLGWQCIVIVFQQEDEPAIALAGIAVLVWLGSGWFYYQSDKPFWGAEARVAELKAELYAYTHEAQDSWKRYVPWDLETAVSDLRRSERIPRQ
jgi:hypothetical protein